MAEMLMDGTGNAYYAEVNDQNKLMVSSSDEGYTTKVTYVNNIPVYMGKSLPPGNTGSPTWQIKKFTDDGTNITDIKWASGVNGYRSFTFVWDSRASYTYV
jgi:hypothetical protein